MKKKVLVGILVLVMLGSSVAGILAYLPYLSGGEDPFADVPYPRIQSYKYADLAGQDASKADLSRLTDPSTLTFDTSTIWPPEDKMPEGFSPQALMDEGRYLGLGLRDLHEQGITGRGITVAVIDRPILKDHVEFGDRLIYHEVSPGDTDSAAVSFHGAAVAGILAGRHGVAPDSKIHYFAIPNDDNTYPSSAQAMDQILALNETLPAQERVRVVAAAIAANAFDEATGVAGAAEWADAVKRAEDAGVIVIYPSMTAVEITGAGAKPGTDRDNPENYLPWTWTTAKRWVVEKIREAGAKSWEDVRKELVRLLTEQPELDSLQAEALNTYIYLAESYKKTSTFENWIAVAEGDLSNSLAVPVDCITVATADSENSYTYYGAGGLSWASPYVAGLMALGLQVNPSATADALLQALKDTGTPFVTGGKIVNPAGFIEAAK
ncbi:MAG: S8 family serine peptidase [Bacillota bacterium]